MPRFFFHTRDGAACVDMEGVLLSDLGDAHRLAVKSAREIMCAEILTQGKLPLSESIIVTSEQGERLFHLDFRSAVLVT